MLYECILIPVLVYIQQKAISQLIAIQYFKNQHQQVLSPYLVSIGYLVIEPSCYSHVSPLLCIPLTTHRLRSGQRLQLCAITSLYPYTTLATLRLRSGRRLPLCESHLRNEISFCQKPQPIGCAQGDAYNLQLCAVTSFYPYTTLVTCHLPLATCHLPLCKSHLINEISFYQKPQLKTYYLQLTTLCNHIFIPIHHTCPLSLATCHFVNPI